MRFSTEHGHYELQPFPGSNQIVCSTHSFIKAEHRGKGLGTDQAWQKITAAEELGYDFLLATIVLDNLPQLKIATKLEYRYLTSFKNSVTGNSVGIFGRELGT